MRGAVAVGGQEQTAQPRMLAGRYELGERLGRGGMGTVWRAVDLMLDREVAVKELTVDHLPEEDLAILQSRMKQEARAAARIKHAGVITIHDVLEQDGRPWIVMELIDGRSLADVTSQDGPLSPRAAAEVGAQVLAALHRGHQLGVLHRDVKPANVLLERGTGRAVLLDFGIAKFEGSSELTRPGDLVGSPDYLAPERAQGGRPGPASDLWGLGATLYAAVEGQSPFRRDNPISTLAAVVDEPLPEPVRAGALGPVLAALMAKAPEERPSADAALRMLRAVTDGHTVSIGPPQPLRMPTQSVPVVDRLAAVEEPEAAEPEEPGPAPAEPVTVAAEPAAGPGRPGRARRLALLVLAAAVLLGGAGYGVLRLTGHRGTPAGDTTPTARASTPSTDQPTAPDTFGPLPTGYHWQQDEQGFRFPLPDDGGTWQRRTANGNNIYYTPDGQRHLIQFAISAGELGSPLDHLRSLETDDRGLKDYKQVSLGANTVNGHEGARWEWTFTCSDKCPNPGPRRVFEEEFKDTDGTAYAILVSAPVGDAVVAQQRFTTILNNFTTTRRGQGAG
ncbi:serine/threonine-protein kinase [Kitasatospora sp. NPDC058965]|uniref:serine/threonine-protein kinase n=1 Tax=Kitasatospora sp. NPDC058965 TaxID=3346682 RepID=UPI0036C9D045